MSDEYDDTNEGDGIKNLRKQYETVAKRNAELEKQLNEFLAEKRTGSVAEILKAKGLPATAAKLYNGEDVSEDAVGKWLEEYADVFGIKQSNENDQNAANAARVAAASGGTEQPISNVEPNQRVLGDPEELMRAIKTLPYDELVKLGYMPDTKGTLYDNHGL